MASANVQAVGVLTEFQAALAEFREKASEALVGMALEMRRVHDWLSDQAMEWKSRIRHAEENVVEARTELMRKRMMRIGDQPADTTDQERLLARAKAWLEHCEEKFAATKKWIRDWPNEVQDCEGHIRAFGITLEVDLPKMMNFLELKRRFLEEYLATPSADVSPLLGKKPGETS